MSCPTLRLPPAIFPVDLYCHFLLLWVGKSDTWLPWAVPHNASPIPASLRLAFSVWVTLPTPHTPSSSVQKLSIQFYTRPHPSVNLPILFFFSRDIPPRATHNYSSTQSPCCPSPQHSCRWALPSPAVLGRSASPGLLVIGSQHLFFEMGFERWSFEGKVLTSYILNKRTLLSHYIGLIVWAIYKIQMLQKK